MVAAFCGLAGVGRRHPRLEVEDRCRRLQGGMACMKTEQDTYNALK
jgi:hypothetical protein